MHPQAVEALKQKLGNYSGVHVSEPLKAFVLRREASNIATGAALEEESRPMGLLGKKLTTAEARYIT